MTRWPSAVAKSEAKLPYRWLPCRGRSPPRSSASDSQPRLDTPASATSDRASSMNAPFPVRSRSCRAASIPAATLTPVIRSQAGRTWLTGFGCPVRPFRAGDLGDADGGVDRVVDGRAAVGVTLDAQVDEVWPFRCECVVGEPRAADHVVDQQAPVRSGGGDERDD